MYNKKFRKIYGPRLPGNSGTLLALIKHAIIRKYLEKQNPKESAYLDSVWKTEVPVHAPDRKFNYLAIVYDDVVEEMIRVDDTTAKYLLGGAKLIPYDPEVTSVKKGMLYEHSQFILKPEENTDDKQAQES